MNDMDLSSTCLVCNTALTGVLGVFSRMGGVRRSDGNPNLCNRCNGHVEEGRIVELGIFFADLTGYTNLTQTLGPDRMHELLDAYLRTAKDVIVKWDGFVTQFVGDEVMAFFNAPLRRDNFAELAVRAGLDLQHAVDKLGAELGQPMDVTVGIAAGHARVGRVGSEEIAHYSAIGDVVNRAARLVSRVSPRGMLVDNDIYTAVAEQFPDADVETITLKGFIEPVTVARLEGAWQKDDAESGEGSTQKLRIATTLAAVLSAPCVGFIALNAAGIALGLGSIGMGAIGMFLDQSILRIPLLTVATLGAIAILYIVPWQHPFARHAEPSGLITEPTKFERRRNRTGVFLAFTGLAIVATELIAHQLMH
ncbi:MAG: adenylate/guanylate cyclase domain-containing protein [Gammaproteobacteria bacterium]|nr:adenylate/guanylate cyclase domain-containing protein [Gammaproteobacteria bacterium]